MRSPNSPGVDRLSRPSGEVLRGCRDWASISPLAFASGANCHPLLNNAPIGSNYWNGTIRRFRTASPAHLVGRRDRRCSTDSVPGSRSHGGDRRPGPGYLSRGLSSGRSRWLAACSSFSSSGRALKASNFSAIKPGMTRQQVAGLLGGPPGDYGRYADGILESGDGSVLQTFYLPSARPSRPDCWQDDRNTFFIFFDDSDRAVAASKATYVRRYSKNSPLKRIQQALSSILP